MASVLDTYNAEIMATQCRYCGKVNDRCKGSGNISNPQASHSIRRRDAGWVWSTAQKRLIRIGSV